MKQIVIPHPGRFKRSLMAVLVGACCASAFGAPTAPTVVNGAATFTQNGNVYTITNTPNTIINWDSFSIDAGEITRFVQENANSAVLNRVLGQDPSKILGALQSNGRVFVINPNGILFGHGSRVDVGALGASTLNMTNTDFIAGKNRFAAGPVARGIVNQGQINAGKVFLIANSVDNSGVITSPRGEVVLAAGHTVQLVDSTDPSMHVVVSAPSSNSVNLGQIIAQGGQVGIYGALVNQRGVINADSAHMGRNGKIVLRASGDTMLEAGSVTSAIGAGNGGQIEVLGRRVGLLGDARVDASGGSGGGSVLVGGGYQGRNAALMNAQNTYFSKDASIRADALASGNGGTVVLWGDATTRAYGRISARGHAGNGGLVETSGHYLDVSGIAVDAGATGGAPGRWLLDPYDIEVNTRGTSPLSDASAFSAGSSQGTTFIHPSLLDNATTSVVLQATHDITFSSPVTMGGVGVNLTAQAGNNINVYAHLNLNGALTLSANDAASGASTGVGRINIDDAVSTTDHLMVLSAADVVFGVTGSANVGSGGAELTSNVAGGIININAGATLTGSGDLRLTADDMNIAGLIDGGGEFGGSTVYLRPLSASRETQIRFDSVLTMLAIKPSYLNNIHANKIVIQGDVTGNLTVNAPFSPGQGQLQTLMLLSANDIIVNSMLDMTTNGVGNSLLVVKTLGSGSLTTNPGAALRAEYMDLRADNMHIGETITAGTLALHPNSASMTIELGNSALDAAGRLAFNQTELGKLEASSLLIGTNCCAASIVVSSDVSVPLKGQTTDKLSLLSGTASIAIDGALTSPGLVSLQSDGGSIAQGTSGKIDATYLHANGGTVSLNGQNAVDGIAGRAEAGDFTFTSANPIFLKLLESDNGIFASGNISLTTPFGIGQFDEAPLQAGNVHVNAGGYVDLNSTSNLFSSISGSAGSMFLDNDLPLTVGFGETGLSLINPTAGTLLHIQTSGLLTVANTLDAGAGNNINLIGDSVQIGKQAVAQTQGFGAAAVIAPVSVIGSFIDITAQSEATGTVNVLGGSTINASTTLRINADQMAFGAGAQLNAMSGSAVFTPVSSNRTIKVGAGALDSSLALGLSDSELMLVNASAIAVYDDTELGGGTLNVVGALDMSAKTGLMQLFLGGTDINVNAPVKAGSLHLEAVGGALNINDLVQGNTVSLEATGGIRGSGIVRGLNSIHMESNFGVGTALVPLDTETGELSVINELDGGAEPINIRNNFAVPGPLTIGSLSQTEFELANNGAITLHNYGALEVGVEGTVQANGGAVTLVAHSPLTVAGSITTTTGAINLEAGGTGDLTIAAGGSVSSGSGNITLTAGGLLTVNGTVATTGVVNQIAPPTLSSCIVTPTAQGCGPILLAATGACIADSSLPNCALILPSMNTCIAAETTYGCEAVLPTISECIADGNLLGCSVVLPTVSECQQQPTMPGCSALLPTLDQCIITPALPNCSAVLPTLNECASTPTLPGCVASLPTPAFCEANPTALGCTVVVPGAQPVIVDVINAVDDATVGTGETVEDKIEQVADEKSDASGSSTAGVNDDKSKKTYCN